MQRNSKNTAFTSYSLCFHFFFRSKTFKMMDSGFPRLQCWCQWQFSEISFKPNGATPSVVKKSSTRASQLLTENMNGHDPLSSRWRRYLETRLHINQPFRHTHVLVDVARWCNPFFPPCVSFFSCFSPLAVLGLCRCPIRFEPTLQRWCEMNGRRVAWWCRRAAVSLDVGMCDMLWLKLSFKEAFIWFYCPGKKQNVCLMVLKEGQRLLW